MIANEDNEDINMLQTTAERRFRNVLNNALIQGEYGNWVAIISMISILIESVAYCVGFHQVDPSGKQHFLQ